MKLAPGDAGELSLRVAAVEALGPRDWLVVVRLCSAAFDEDFDVGFRAHPGTTHVLAHVDDRLASPACRLIHRLQPGTRRSLSTARVEAVAIASRCRRKGYAGTVTGRLSTADSDYKLGALPPSMASLYERPAVHPHRLRGRRGPRDAAMVLRLPGTPHLDPWTDR